MTTRHGTGQQRATARWNPRARLRRADPLRRILVGGLLAASIAMCPACKKSGVKQGDALQAEIGRHGRPSQIYTVRGQVESLPEQGDPTAEFMVHHEPIPDFVNQKGQTVGMSSMTMPFPVPEELSLQGLHKGDVISLTFAVWYKPVMRFSAVKVAKLPADTALDFGPAHTPDDAGEAGGP